MNILFFDHVSLEIKFDSLNCIYIYLEFIISFGNTGRINVLCSNDGQTLDMLEWNCSEELSCLKNSSVLIKNT